MIKLSADRLAGLGYRGLTQGQVNELLRELYNAGEEIVGLQIVARMSDDQVDAFGSFVDADDRAGAMAWLERNVPDYRELVQETFANLDEVLRRAAEETRRGPELPQSEKTSQLASESLEGDALENPDEDPSE